MRTICSYSCSGVAHPPTQVFVINGLDITITSFDIDTIKACRKDNDSQSPMRDENINISDVIEVIETDPDFKQPERGASAMYGGQAAVVDPAQVRRHATVKLVEQPASKALRFRYECEGRSAGSIPGSSSTAENKTFPCIQIHGYKGKAVVVVSCVTKDPPYRPHPHNLVGREGCRKGVCTLEISPETMSITFSNLGIQCVKKKDIESHLKIREEIRVDPFKTGFNHRNQPTSIDLNAVRLCFQVFIEGDKPGKFTVPLAPVVSDPIYDKKAMSDLVIVKLSDCVSTVDGGRKDIILLCEKVAKEDIQVRFFEENSKGELVWEGFGDFQPSQVHKQTAIWFKTPRYKTLDIIEPVKVNIQLRRPSDGATSESLPFELLPLDSGRPTFWSMRRTFSKKGNYNLFNTILANDAELVRKRQLSNITVENVENNNNIEAMEVTPTPTLPIEPAYGEIKKNKPSEIITDEKLDEIIQEVVEMDQIYSDNQKRLEELNKIEEPTQESFDDSKTYSSLQMAFKNPVQVVEIDITDINDKYEDVIINPDCPVIDLGAKREIVIETETEKLPPLPPKRARKVIETDIDDPGPVHASVTNLNQKQPGSIHSIALTSEQAENLLTNTSTTPISLSRSHSFNMQRPKSQTDLAPCKKLPPKPTSTLPNPKKRGFFSKLFGKKEKSNSQPSSLVPSKRNSLASANSLQVTTLNRTPSNASNRSTASIRIPLKGSLNDLNKKEPLNDLNQDIVINNNINNINGSNLELLENDDFNMNLDLTEAEHYALYTAMAPHATQRVKRKRKYDPDPNSNLLRPLKEQDTNRGGSPHQSAYNLLSNIPVVKAEPVDNTSPYVSPIYGNVSPMYAPSISPQHQIYHLPIMNMGPTPPPQEYNINITYPPNNNLNPVAQTGGLPSMGTWNIPTTSNLDMTGATAMSIDSAPGLSSLLNLDSNQLQLEPINLNSDDLSTFNMFDANNLSENLSNNLSLNDVPRNQNMSDSLTRLAQTTYDNMCMLQNNVQQ